MANTLYDPGREGFLDGSIDWDTDDVRVALLPATYTYSAAHKFVSELSGIIARSGALTGKTVTNGIANAASVTIPAVSGAQITHFSIYKYNAADAAARLIAHIDTATGMPVTPNGGDIIITWDSGANKIFKL